MSAEPGERLEARLLRGARIHRFSIFIVAIALFAIFEALCFWWYCTTPATQARPSANTITFLEQGSPAQGRQQKKETPNNET